MHLNLNISGYEGPLDLLLDLSKKQKELLKEFEQEGKSADNSPESAGFFSKVKDLWEDLKD